MNFHADLLEGGLRQNPAGANRETKCGERAPFRNSTASFCSAVKLDEGKQPDYEGKDLKALKPAKRS